MNPPPAYHRRDEADEMSGGGGGGIREWTMDGSGEGYGNTTTAAATTHDLVEQVI